MSNQILKALPACYRNEPEQAEIADGLTRAIASLYSDLKNKLENYEFLYLNPTTCNEEWLDILAIWAGWGDYWDLTRSPAIKRKLLSSSPLIFQNRGNREAISTLFPIFNLQAAIAPTTGWMLGQTLLPALLNADPFAYLVKVPVNYSPGTPEHNLIARLIREFLPCWISLEFVYG